MHLQTVCNGKHALSILSLICIGAYMDNVFSEPILQQRWALPMLVQRLCHLCLLDSRHHSRELPQPGAPLRPADAADSHQWKTGIHACMLAI